MKKFTEFFKGKGYYVLLFVGVLAIAAVAVVGSQLSSSQKEEGRQYANLNDTEDTNIAENGDEDTQLAENNPVSEGITNNLGNSTDNAVTNEDANPAVESSGNQVEYEGYDTEAVTDKTQTAEQPDASKDTASADTEEAKSVETASDSVQADTSSIIENLSFKTDDGLAWPVQGNVIMNYSMDHTIYFATLMQYKVNPAIIIGAEVGTKVKAAAKAVVSSIEENNAETGYTVTMNLGDDYSVVYGQLDKDSVNLKVGDVIEEGDVIGTVAKPTKYYSVEGANLYFQVLEDEKSVNPMLLLRSGSEE